MQTDANAGAELVGRLLDATSAGTAGWKLEAGVLQMTHRTADITLTRRVPESYLLEVHRDERTILRYDGIVPGVTSSPKLAPRTQLRELFELAMRQCVDPDDQVGQLLDEL